MKKETTSQDLIIDIFQFLKTEFDFQEPEKFSVAFENHVVYTNGKIQIDFIDEGNWDLPNITIKGSEGKYASIPDNWFNPAGIQPKIFADYRRKRELSWLSEVDPKLLDTSTYPLTQKVVEDPKNSYHIRGRKIVAIYLLIASHSLKLHLEEIPSLFSNRILNKVKNYLQKWV